MKTGGPMPEMFFDLPEKEARAVLQAGAAATNVSATILEKDIWVCLVLKVLFEMPNRPRFAFRGGTSLSKVFGAIDRFSEDIDVTIDFRDLASGFDPFAPGITKSKLKKTSDDLLAGVSMLVLGDIVAHLSRAFATMFPDGSVTVAPPTGETRVESLVVSYAGRALAADPNQYLKPSVLLEFGGRNISEPNKSHRVKPQIADAVPALAWPIANIDVLVAERTFWEKVTLAHVECRRPQWKTEKGRMARHWYDLAVLSEHAIGESALADLPLLDTVVQHKSAFFAYSFVDYRECASGKLCLLPGDDGLGELRRDYEAMIATNMFSGKPLPFDEITGRIRALEKRINELTVERGAR